MDANKKRIYLKVDRYIEKSSKQFSFLKYLNPINEKSERNKFIKDETYEPNFKYNKVPKDYKTLLKELVNNQIVYSKNKTEDEILKIYEKKRQENIHKLSLVIKRDLDFFQKTTEKIYPVNKDKIYENEAKKELKQFNEIQKLKSTTDIFKEKEMEYLFKETFKKYRLKEWKVKINKDFTASCYVDNKLKTLNIKKHNLFQPKRVWNLIIHEIETHILRTENALTQNYKIFRKGFPNYLKTEEGLATFNAKKFGYMDESSFISNIRYLTFFYAKNHSFSETFQFVKKHGFEFQTSWEMAMRFKRGLNDVSNKGAFSKDAIYYEGYKEIEHKLDTCDLKKLYVGKIGIEHLDIVNKFEPNNPKYFPEYYHLF